MHCEHCGNQIEGSHRFCIKCGHSVSNSKSTKERVPLPVMEDRWWHRLLKVSYIFIYLQILWIVPAVWVSNSTSYEYIDYATHYGVGYGGNYEYVDTYGVAFWYSVLALVIFVVVTRLIKLTTLYIFFAQKPEWRQEFKKLF